MAGHGWAWMGMAGHGLAWLGWAWLLGVAGHDLAWLEAGEAWIGLGMARIFCATIRDKIHNHQFSS